MLRRVFCLSLMSSALACSEEPCRQAAPSVSIDLVADDVERATSIRDIEVRIRYQGQTLVRSFELGDQLFDGTASVDIELTPAPTESFVLNVEVEARMGSLTLFEAAEAQASADGCNRIAIDLTDSVPPPPPPPPGDAGVDAGARDAGNPPIDAGFDAGFDAGEPDLGLPEVCGDGLVTQSEACDDGNEVDADGCSGCTVDQNFGCSGSPSRCEIWWNSDYPFRQRVSVAVGPKTPLGGYEFYTLRIQGLDTAQLMALGRVSDDCSDIRVVFADSPVDSVAALPRNIVRCGSTDTELHFMSPVDLPANALVDRFFIYFGGPSATFEEETATRNVYLFYDDATSDRSGRYVRGRIDDWYDAWDDSLRWNPSGYYNYSSGNDTASGYRRLVGERDVYAEAEFYHTGCAPQNMVTGIILRGVIASGSTNTETASHYYFSGRLDQEGCAEGYLQDGDISRGHWRDTVVDGDKPPRIVSNTWRKHALAASGEQSTTLISWDADQAWSSPGFPDRDPLVRGTDPAAATSPGFAGFMTNQDTGRVRRFLVRRFTDPEPLVMLGPEEFLP